MIEFRLSAQLPGGKNAVKMTRTGHRYPDERFTAWRDRAVTEIRIRSDICPKMLPLKGALTMRVDYCPQDRRRRDLDNMLSALFHLLAYVGMIEDDSQITDLIWRRHVIRSQPVCAMISIEGRRRET